MDIATIPPKAMEALLQDIINRDPATARRIALLKILLKERYLTRPQLITRVENLLSTSCYGVSAWEDVFYRDVRVVKQAFLAAGYVLRYSRSAENPGYYLQGQPAISAELAEIITHSLNEVDPIQLRTFQRMVPAERFRLGCSVTDAAVNAVAYRIMQSNPGIDLTKASYLALQGNTPH